MTAEDHRPGFAISDKLRAGWAFQLACLMLIAQPLVFYRRVLFKPIMSIPFDISAYHLPLSTYIARCVRQGIFPFWDPYPYCGVPIHADLTAQLFYPVTWISILLGNLSEGRKLYYWIEWLDPLHMILGGLFTFLLLRSMGLKVPAALFGGTVYQLGGFFASQAQHLGAICTGAWLPLVLLCVWRLSREVTARWIALLAVGIALTVLSGFTATTEVVFVAAALFAIGLTFTRRLRWKFWAALAIGFVLGHGVSAVQLIPTYQLTGLSVASIRAQAEGTGGGLPLQSLASLISPNHYHILTPSDLSQYKLPFNFTFMYVYCGIPALVLALIAPLLRSAPYARMFFCFTVISALWMLGGETPVYRFVFTHLPHLVRGSVYSEFALLAFSFFAALTAAVALERLGNRAPGWPLWALVLLTATDLTKAGAMRPMNSAPGGYKQNSSEYQVFGDPGALARIHSLIDTAKPPLRVDYVKLDVLLAQTGAEQLALPTPDGDNPFALKRVIDLRRLFSGGNWWERQLPVNRPLSPLLSMLNVGILGDLPQFGPVPQLDRLPPAGDIAGVRFYRNPNVLPRFFLVHRVRPSGREQETLSYLARPDFKPAEEAIIEPPDNLEHWPASLAGGEVRVLDYSANRVELQVTTEGQGFLASSETMYPGWTATVNGRSAPLYMTNGAFRGLFVNPGSNRVVMTYWPEHFTGAAAISIFSAILVLLPWCRIRRRVPEPDLRKADLAI